MVTIEAPSWHAVSIAGGSAPCLRARECGTQRFLSAEAPRLPLQGCDAAVCECRYRHHQDRRAKPRRLVDRGELRRPFTGVEQRVISRGRRSSDA
jgi:hypothetical protein